MRPALDSAGHRVPRTKPTCLLHTWRPHRRRPFALVLHLHQHQSSRNLHLQYLVKNQSTQHCKSLITPGSDHPSVVEPHMVLNGSDNIFLLLLVCRGRASTSSYTCGHFLGLHRSFSRMNLSPLQSLSLVDDLLGEWLPPLRIAAPIMT
jgi:hypothetical protein